MQLKIKFKQILFRLQHNKKKIYNNNLRKIQKIIQVLMSQQSQSFLQVKSILDLVAYSLLAFVVLLTFSHIMSSLSFSKKSSLKLNQNSFVIITGGCMGIGRQMAIQIAGLYHCKIMIVDIKKDLFEQLNKKLLQLGSVSEFHLCNLADQGQVEDLIGVLKQRNQRIDFFIHNAGIHIPKRMLQTSQKQFIMQYRVNFLSPVKIIKQTIDLTGHIGVIASMVAIIHGGIDVSTYSSSKNALYSFINCLRQQLKVDKRNVTISMGCPYLIRTSMFQGFKTKLDFLVRPLQPSYAAKRLIKQFIQKKQICYIYQYEALIFRMINLFPTSVLDYISIHFNVSNFEKIRDKHNQRVLKLK